MSTDPMQNPDPLLNQESLAAAEGMPVPNRAAADEPKPEAEVAQASATEPPAADAATAEASTAEATAEATTAEAVATDAAATTEAATTAASTEATAAGGTTSEAAAAGALTADGAAVAGSPAEGSVDAAIAAAAPVVAARPVTRLRGRVIVGARRLVRFAFALALFSLGVYAGLDAFRSNQPVTGPVGDPAVNGVPAPALVAELANAIAADDADAIRAALQPQTFSRYTAEMERFGITTVQSVETLGTYNDDGRTATALVILGRTTDQSPFSINLIVLTENGQIVSFR